MILTILQALYFMLPAYIANIMPVLLKWVPLGEVPINEKFFGVNKTWRGFVSGVIGGIAGLCLQKILNSRLSNIELLPYGTFDVTQIFLYGMAFGGGALLGDLLKSFVKRRLGIPSGKPWVPFDQLDFVIGALLAVSIFYIPPALHIFIIVIITPLLHLATNATAYFLGLKKVWW